MPSPMDIADARQLFEGWMGDLHHELRARPAQQHGKSGTHPVRPVPLRQVADVHQAAKQVADGGLRCS